MKKAVILFLSLMMLSAPKLWAQFVPSWGGGSDQQDFSFGFTFQYINSDFKIVKNPNWRDRYIDYGTGRPVFINGQLKSINSNSMPGFGIGFIARYSFNQYLEVRTNPSLVFSDKLVKFAYEDPSQDATKQIQTTSVDLPLSVKLKSDRILDGRVYILGGIKYSHAINRRPDEGNLAPQEKLLKMTRAYTAYEAGVGFDIYFEYFKLSPELKLSNSFNNVLLQDNNLYSSRLSKLFLHTISFSLYFE